MEIKKTGMAGTLESSDALVTVEQNPSKGITIHLKSPVEKQFGKQIKTMVEETVKKLGVSDAILRIEDKGALDCTLKARVQAAIDRATENAKIDWGTR